MQVGGSLCSGLLVLQGSTSGGLSGEQRGWDTLAMSPSLSQSCNAIMEAELQPKTRSPGQWPPLTPLQWILYPARAERKLSSCFSLP